MLYLFQYSCLLAFSVLNPDIIIRPDFKSEYLPKAGLLHGLYILLSGFPDTRSHS